MSQEDKIFVKRFTLILAALVVVTIVIAIVASKFQTRLTQPDNPSRTERIEDRLKPVAGVYQGEQGQAELAAAQAAEPADQPVAAQVDEPASQPAAGGETDEAASGEAPAAAAAVASSIDAQAIYNATCAACHNVGVAGAPKLVAEDWTERLTKGVDGLTASAINGIGIMPPKGGRGDLSDETIRAAVEYMLAQFQE